MRLTEGQMSPLKRAKIVFVCGVVRGGGWGMV